jgi:hypothetical protein
MERETGHENLVMECVDAELIQRAIYVLNNIMIINSVQADFPKIHSLCEAGGSRWAGVTDPGYSFRERMPESVGAPDQPGAFPSR